MYAWIQVIKSQKNRNLKILIFEVGAWVPPQMFRRGISSTHKKFELKRTKIADFSIEKTSKIGVT